MIGAAALMLVAAIGSAPPTPDRLTPDRLTPDQLGAVRIGMTVSRAERALGTRLRPVRGAGASSRACSYSAPVLGHDHALYMIEQGRVTRIDVAGRAVRTDRGIGIGSSVGALHRAYPSGLTRRRDIYTDEPDFEFRAPGAAHGLVFETEHGRVARLRNGRYPSLRYVEGCD